MKANELRIGNWFFGDCTNGENHEITALEILDLNDDPLDDYYQPIPLTEEWLLKFGFEKQSGGYVEYFKKGWYVNSKMLFSDGVSGLFYLKHVHQLQNLYFALTGEELQITNDTKNS